MNPPNCIFIATGPTGGHFFPAVSLIQALAERYPGLEIHLLLNQTPKFPFPVLEGLPVRVHRVPFSPPRKVFSLNVFSVLIEYVRAFWQTGRLIQNHRPQSVIGFGSYGSVPAVLAAVYLGIPVLIHEQNESAGHANRFLAYWTDRAAISFPETRGISPLKSIWTGYPLRKEFLDGIRSAPDSSQAEDKFKVLVFGGSQGSERINTVFLETIFLLSPEEKKRFAVIHISGNEAAEHCRSVYRQAGIQASVSAFSNQIHEAFRDCDLIISRAGAGTVFEMAAAGRTGILIPYPYAYAHQKRNAEYLTRRGWAREIDEKDLTAEKLYGEIMFFWKHPDARRQAAHGIAALAKQDAAKILAETVCKL